MTSSLTESSFAPGSVTKLFECDHFRIVLAFPVIFEVSASFSTAIECIHAKNATSSAETCDMCARYKISKAIVIATALSSQTASDWLQPGVGGIIRATTTHSNEGNKSTLLEAQPAAEVGTHLSSHSTHRFVGLAPVTYYMIHLSVEVVDIRSNSIPTECAAMPTVWKLPLATWHLPTCVACEHRNDSSLRISVSRLDNRFPLDTNEANADKSGLGDGKVEIVKLPVFTCGRPTAADVNSMRYTLQATPVGVPSRRDSLVVHMEPCQATALLSNLVSDTLYRCEVRSTWHRSADNCDDPPVKLWGLFGVACFVHTLPKPRATVVSVSPIQAIAIVEQLSGVPFHQKCLSGLTPEQKRNYLPVGGADEYVYVIARVQQPNAKSDEPRKRSTNNADIANEDLAATQVKDDDENSLDDDVDGSSSSSGDDVDPSSDKKNISSAAVTTVGSSYQLQGLSDSAALKCEILRSNGSSTTSDFLIAGCIAIDSPFVLDGLTPRTAYSIKFFTLAPSDYADMMAISQRSNLRFLLDVTRFIGKSSFTTVQMMRGVSVDDSKSQANNQHKSSLHMRARDAIVHNAYVNSFGKLVDDEEDATAGTLAKNTSDVYGNGAFENGESYQGSAAEAAREVPVEENLAPIVDAAKSIVMSTNAASGITVRNVTDGACEFMLTSDFSTVAHAAVVAPAETSGTPNAAAGAAAMFRRKVLAEAKKIRSGTKSIFCARILEVPRGDVGYRRHIEFLSTKTFPIRPLKASEIAVLLQRSGNRIEESFTVEYTCIGENGKGLDGPLGDLPASRSASSAGSQDGLDGVDSAVQQSDSPDFAAPFSAFFHPVGGSIDAGAAADTFRPTKSASLFEVARGLHFSMQKESSIVALPAVGADGSPPPDEKVHRQDLEPTVELVTVRQIFFASCHGKIKLNTLNSDSRFHVSVCSAPYLVEHPQIVASPTSIGPDSVTVASVVPFPTFTGSGTSGVFTRNDPEEVAPLDWKGFCPPESFITQYVPRKVEIVSYMPDGIRFELNSRLSAIEYNKLMHLRSHGPYGAVSEEFFLTVLASHVEQDRQKFCAVEFLYLDDEKQNKSFLVEQGPKHSEVYEFRGRFNIDGRYKLRVRIATPSIDQNRTSGGTDTAPRTLAAKTPPVVKRSAFDGTASRCQSMEQHVASSDEALRFGPYGPFVFIAIVGGDILDTEECEKGLRCFCHSPVSNLTKSQSTRSSRKATLVEMKKHARRSMDDFRDRSYSLKAGEREGTCQTGLTQNGGIHILQTCAYVNVSCASQNLYFANPVVQSEIHSHIIHLRHLSPGTYVMALRALVVLSEICPPWKENKSRSGSITFATMSGGDSLDSSLPKPRVQRGTLSRISFAPVPPQAMVRPPQRRASLATIIDSAKNTPVTQSIVAPAEQIPSTPPRAGFCNDPDDKPNGATERASDKLEEQDLFAHEAASNDILGNSLNNASKQQSLILNLHTSFKRLGKHDLGICTIYHRHEILPLSIGETHFCVTAVISATSLFDVPGYKMGEDSDVSFAAPMPDSRRQAAMVAEYTKKITHADKTDSKVSNLMTSAAACLFPKNTTHSIETANGADDHNASSSDRAGVSPPEPTFNDPPDSSLTKEKSDANILLGMHGCKSNSYAEPIYSTRRSRLRYPLLVADTHIQNLSVEQERRMQAFAEQFSRNCAMNPLAPFSARHGGDNLVRITSTVEPIIELPPILAETDITEQQILRRDIALVQIEVTKAEELTNKKAKLVSYNPSLADKFFISGLESGCEYRLRLRVQGRFNTSGSVPNFSKWSLPIRVTTSTKWSLACLASTESAMSIAWSRDIITPCGVQPHHSSHRNSCEVFSFLRDKDNDTEEAWFNKDVHENKSTAARADDAVESSSSVFIKEHDDIIAARLLHCKVVAGLVDLRRVLPHHEPNFNNRRGQKTSDSPTSKGRSKKTPAYLRSLLTNSHVLQVEVCLFDGSAAKSERRRLSPSSSGPFGRKPARKEKKSSVSVDKLKRIDAANIVSTNIHQTCIILAPAHCEGLRLNELYPGMKYTTRIRCISDMEADTIAKRTVADINSNHSSDKTAVESTSQSRRHSVATGSIACPTACGAWSNRLPVHTLSDVNVIIARIGADYCVVSASKVVTDTSALDPSLRRVAAADEIVPSDDEDVDAAAEQSVSPSMALGSGDFASNLSIADPSVMDEAAPVVGSSQKRYIYQIRFRRATDWEAGNKEQGKELPANSIKLGLAKQDNSSTWSVSESDSSDVYPSFQSQLCAETDVMQSTEFGVEAVEVVANKLLPNTLYIVAIRPCVGGTSASGQWIDMLRFLTAHPTKTKIVSLCEDQMLFSWSPPTLLYVHFVSRTTKQSALGESNGAGAAVDVSDDENDTQDLRRESAVSNIEAPGSQHPYIDFQVRAVEFEIEGKFLDPMKRVALVPLQETADALPVSKINRQIQVVAPVVDTNRVNTPTSRPEAAADDETLPGEDSPATGTIQLLVDNLIPDSTYTIRLRVQDKYGMWSAFFLAGRALTHPSLQLQPVSIGETFAVMHLRRAPRSMDSLRVLSNCRRFYHNQKSRVRILDMRMAAHRSRLDVLQQFGLDQGDNSDNSDDDDEVSDDELSHLSREQLYSEMALLDHLKTRANKSMEEYTAYCSLEDLSQSISLATAPGPTFEEEAVSQLRLLDDPRLYDVDAMHVDVLFALAHKNTVSANSPHIFVDDDVSPDGGSPHPQTSREVPHAHLVTRRYLFRSKNVRRVPKYVDASHQMHIQEDFCTDDSDDDSPEAKYRRSLQDAASLASATAQAVGADAGLTALTVSSVRVEDHRVSLRLGPTVHRASNDILIIQGIPFDTAFYLCARLVTEPFARGVTVPLRDSAAAAPVKPLQSPRRRVAQMIDGPPTLDLGASLMSAVAASSMRTGGGASLPPLFRRLKDGMINFVFGPQAKVCKGFRDGMWSSPCTLKTLSPTVFKAIVSSEHEVFVTVSRPTLGPHTDTPKENTPKVAPLGLQKYRVMPASARRANNPLQCVGRYHLAVNGKMTALRNSVFTVESGEEKLIHLHGLDVDSDVTIHARTLFLFDDVIGNAPKSTQVGAPPALTFSSTTISRSKKIFIWSHYQLVVTGLRTRPLRPSLPVLYESRPLPPHNFTSSGFHNRPESTGSWKHYMSMWWSRNVHAKNMFPVEMQDRDARSASRSRADAATMADPLIASDSASRDNKRNNTPSATTAETAMFGQPLTCLAQQAKLIHVCYDEKISGNAAVLEDMTTVSAQYHPSLIVSIQAPIGRADAGSVDSTRCAYIPPPQAAAMTHLSEAVVDEDNSSAVPLYEAVQHVYSFDVEIAEYWPVARCHSDFVPVATIAVCPFMRLQLPQDHGEHTHKAVPLDRLVFRIRTRVSAPATPTGIISSSWSPTIGWKTPPVPPPVYNVICTQNALGAVEASCSYPTRQFHNQLVFELHLRSSVDSVYRNLDTAEGEKIYPFSDHTKMCTPPLGEGLYFHVAVRACTTFGKSPLSSWTTLPPRQVKIHHKTPSLAGSMTPQPINVNNSHPDGSAKKLTAPNVTTSDTLTPNAAAAADAKPTASTLAINALLSNTQIFSGGLDVFNQDIWSLPFPQPRTADAFPCPIDTNFHVADNVVERRSRRTHPEQTAIVGALVPFAAKVRVVESSSPPKGARGKLSFNEPDDATDSLPKEFQHLVPPNIRSVQSLKPLILKNEPGYVDDYSETHSDVSSHGCDSVDGQLGDEAGPPVEQLKSATATVGGEQGHAHSASRYPGTSSILKGKKDCSHVTSIRHTAPPATTTQPVPKMRAPTAPTSNPPAGPAPRQNFTEADNIFLSANTTLARKLSTPVMPSSTTGKGNRRRSGSRKQQHPPTAGVRAYSLQEEDIVGRTKCLLQSGVSLHVGRNRDTAVSSGGGPVVGFMSNPPAKPSSPQPSVQRTRSSPARTK